MVSKVRQYFKAADHLLHVTYPLIRDPKLLPAIVTNLAQSIEAALSYLVPKEDTIQKKINQLKSQKNIDPEDEKLILIIISLAKFHKKSPVEFSRGDKFIICDTKFNVRALNARQLQDYVSQVDNLLSKLENSKLIK